MIGPNRSSAKGRRHFFVSLILAAIWGGVVCATSAAADLPLYKNPDAPLEQRVNDLMSRMTLEEKVQQLRCINGVLTKSATRGAFDPAKAAMLFGEGIGEIAPMDEDAVKEVTFRNAVQAYLMEKTRLGIPAIFHDEACHGFRDIGATSFPAPIGMACAWDPELMRRVYGVAAAQMRARGVAQALAPVVDICRDPRWGRTDETMGEDPYLNGTLAAAVVEGLQGSSDGTIGPGHVAATLKHFAGHGQPEGGINRAPGDIPMRQMWDAHLVPFEIAIAQAHPAAVMPSYNEVDGVPSHDNAWLLQDVLRKTFLFSGLVVSDYTGVEYLASVHHVAADDAQAAALALQCGVDVDLPDGRAYAHLADLVRQGRVAESAVDAAVRRILNLKFSLGLFEQPYGDARKAVALDGLESSKKLAREAAEKSIVLLTNHGNILPLARGKYKTIAVIGPDAASARLGSYSGEPAYKVSILDGVRQRVGGDSSVLYAEGCKINLNLPESSLAAWQAGGIARFPTTQQSQTAIAEAVGVAKQADLILLVLGENEMMSREAWAANHLGDRSTLDLPGAQNDLANAMFALGKPVVVYLMNGRPLAVPEIASKADALLEGWYMGQETGNAVADILFGDVNPSGKLTITVPRATGQIPDYYDAKPSARIYDYVDLSRQPLFPFGYGLSYTTFSYSQPHLNAPVMSTQGSVTVSTMVTNTGSVAGDEIVEFYIHQKLASVTRPVMELKGFRRITLAAGESRTVDFEVTPAMLAFHDIHMNLTVEPGDFEMMVGPSAANVKTVTLAVK